MVILKGQLGSRGQYSLSSTVAEGVETKSGNVLLTKIQTASGDTANIETCIYIYIQNLDIYIYIYTLRDRESETASHLLGSCVRFFTALTPQLWLQLAGRSVASACRWKLILLKTLWQCLFLGTPFWCQKGTSCKISR